MGVAKGSKTLGPPTWVGSTVDALRHLPAHVGYHSEFDSC